MEDCDWARRLFFNTTEIRTAWDVYKHNPFLEVNLQWAWVQESNIVLACIQ